VKKGASLIRLASSDDAADVAAIYAPYVRDTAITFEIEPPSADEMRDRIVKTLVGYPWLVCVQGAGVVGYAYAGQHRSRAAYQWSADVSIYVRTGAHRRGIGRALYTALLRMLPLQGYCNAYGGVTLPNPASVGLHESFGFRPVGIYERVGFKHGAWHDVGWWALRLQSPPRPDGPARELALVQGTQAWKDALASGQRLLDAR